MVANYPSTAPSGTPATHGAVVDEVVALAGDAVSSPRPITGRWYPGTNSNPGTAQLTGEGDMDVCWWDLPHGTVIAEIAENVTVVGTTGAVRRLVAYAHDPATGRPGTLLADAGTYDATVLGVRSVVVSGGATVVGAYGVWLGGVTQGAAGTRPTMSGMTNPQRGVHLAAAGNFTAVWVGYRHTAVSGAAPGTFTGTSTLSGGMARQLVKIG